MTRLLLLGLLAGLIASFAAFGVARLIGEPPLSAAIALEAPGEHADEPGTAGHSHEDAGISRQTQAGIGLFVGMAAIGVVLGGVLSVAYSLARGRLAFGTMRGTVAWIAVLGFVAVILVPMLKYPGNPPAVGDPETIGQRTLSYFAFLALSLATLGMVVSLVRGMTVRRMLIIGGGLYVGIMGAAGLFMPSFPEIDAIFPSDLLWQFRASTLAVQVTLWASTAAIFAFLVEGTAALRLPAGRSCGFR